MTEDQGTQLRPFSITSPSSPTSTYLEIQDLRSATEDTKSNKSAMTSKSTREVFDLLAKLLPLGILLLIISIMVHFVTYVKDIQPVRQISEILCMSLAATVIPLSIVFILRTICDCRDNRRSYWYNSYECNCNFENYQSQQIERPIQHERSIQTQPPQEDTELIVHYPMKGVDTN